MIVLKTQLCFRFQKNRLLTDGAFSNGFYPSKRIRCIVLKMLRNRNAHVQGISNDSPTFKRKKKRGFLFTISYYKFSPFKISKASKNHSRAKGKAKFDSSLSKSFVFRRPHKCDRVSLISKKIHSGESFLRGALSVIVFIVYM